MRRLFTSEAVSEGHPDKFCDIIADTILDECLKQDEESRVACEVLAKDETIVVAGEMTTNAIIDIKKIVKDVIKEIGYDDYEPEVINLLNHQSPDIAQGVDIGGAGDQGIMFGYANSETKELMPLAIVLAHKLVALATKFRKSGEFKWAKPDMKSQVTIEYNNNEKRIDTILMSIQHDENYNEKEFKEFIKTNIMKQVAKQYNLNEDFNVLINPTGRFVIGGPKGDCGLTGRKLIVDTYGGYAPHGGGAFSGKDPSKVDRSASYMARYIAKNIVEKGLATECLIELSYAIGVEKPISIFVDCNGTNTIKIEEIIKFINNNFDLTPRGMIKTLKLREPIYHLTARGGHFGREFLDDEGRIECTWETCKAF
ncbi:MAG: methionine adenosyltransferase [Clostridia bacterium]|nr:methionine adenosyltransferase [Clostridia bacterium]